jgi:hypothetical protein
MKRIRLLVLLGAVAVALPLGLATAKATGTTGGTGTANVSINQYADFDTAGTNIDVGLNVSCTGESVIDVTLKQTYPETGSPVTVGSGPQPLVACDGRTHSVGVTVFGVGFDTGRAFATATVLGAPTEVGGEPGPVKATASRWVIIRQV